MTTPIAIEVEHLVKRFGNIAALDGLDLTVGTGEVHGFLGPNGSGKSTTIRVLLGLHRPTSGSVRVLGLDPGRHAARVTRRTSYVPGDVALWPSLTGQEVLDALAGIRGDYDTVAEQRLIEAFALDPSRKVRTYSKGNRQKVMLVAAFAARTDLLVLDEPTSGLDPLMEKVFQNCVREAAEAGRTVLLSSHILAEVEHLCAAVTIIKQGRGVESGRLVDLRHLAASEITAVITVDAVSTVNTALREATAGAGPREGRAAVTEHGQQEVRHLQVTVSRDRVGHVLGVLADVGAQNITCTPATLEDLFLRHYETVAR